MSVTAAALRELHRIQRQLSDLRDRRERGPKQIKAREANVARLEAELAKTQQDAKAAKMASDQKHLDLRAREDKLTNLQNRLSACSTNKEYQALQEQIAADKVALSVLEDEILEAMTKVDEFKPRIAAAEENLGKAKKELERARQDVAGQKQSIETDLVRLDVELRQAETVLPAEFRAAYDRIVKARGQDAMAVVEEGICGGCYQQITPNMYNNLRRSVAVFCNSCGRLLYLPEEPSGQ